MLNLDSSEIEDIYNVLPSRRSYNSNVSIYQDIQHNSVKEIYEPNVYDHCTIAFMSKIMRAEHGKLNKITVSITSYNSNICFISGNERQIE